VPSELDLSNACHCLSYLVSLSLESSVESVTSRSDITNLSNKN